MAAEEFKDGTESPSNRPDENTVAEHCIGGPDWRTGTVLPQCKPEYVQTDEGKDDQIVSVDTSQFGSDFEPNVRRRN